MGLIVDDKEYGFDEVDWMQTKLQEQLKDVKHQIFRARNLLVQTMIRRKLQDMVGEPYYADRNFAVAEQHLNLALLALAEGREQMRHVE